MRTFLSDAISQKLFRLDVVIGLFGRLVSAEEQKIAAEIESKGGASKIRPSDDTTLKTLIAFEISVRKGADERGAKVATEEQEKQPGAVQRGKSGMTTKNTFSLDELKSELREDVDDALERNFKTFIGKFELQVSMLQVALERYIRSENDRVIGAVKDAMTQGPHMKIKDPVRISGVHGILAHAHVAHLLLQELRKIWQDMVSVSSLTWTTVILIETYTRVGEEM